MTCCGKKRLCAHHHPRAEQEQPAHQQHLHLDHKQEQQPLNGVCFWIINRNNRPLNGVCFRNISRNPSSTALALEQQAPQQGFLLDHQHEQHTPQRQHLLLEQQALLNGVSIWIISRNNRALNGVCFWAITMNNIKPLNGVCLW
ncbi:hypothetical protein ACFX2B_009895 [Malus domestica]